MEVVSEEVEVRERDLFKKRRDYAEGRIAEYWIVDPLTKQITVLTLHGNAYVEHGVFSEEQEATSKLLDGFRVKVSDVFSAATV